MPLHLCTAELVKYHLKGRRALWREQEVVLLSQWCLAVALALPVPACPCLGPLLMQHAGIAAPVKCVYW